MYSFPYNSNVLRYQLILMIFFSGGSDSGSIVFVAVNKDPDWINFAISR